VEESNVPPSADFSWSLGFSVGGEDALANVWWNSPAFKVGITPGMKLVAVNDEAYNANRLREAIVLAEKTATPIKLLLRARTIFKPSVSTTTVARAIPNSNASKARSICWMRFWRRRSRGSEREEVFVMRRILIGTILVIFTAANSLAGDASVLRFDGIGPIKIGMSLAQLNLALQERFKMPPARDDQACFYVDSKKTPSHQLHDSGGAARAH